MGGPGPSGPSRGSYDEYMNVDDLPGSPFGGSVFGSRSGSQRKRANSFTGASAGTSNDTGEKEKTGEIVKPLKLSLEELHKGTTKKLKLTRKLLDGRSEEKVVEINVRIVVHPIVIIYYTDRILPIGQTGLEGGNSHQVRCCRQ